MSQRQGTRAGNKQLPYSLEAERSVLGAILLDNQALDKIAGRLVADDFYLPEHREVFAAILQLLERDQPCDPLTLAEHLKRRHQLEAVGGETFLFELANQTPSATNIQAYAGIVHEQSVLRALVAAGQYIADLAFDPREQSPQDLLDQAESRIFGIGDNRRGEGGPEGISTIMARTTERIDELYHTEGTVTGTGTGFQDLDEMTSGLHSGDLVIVAGRPSMGKTCFSINIAEHVALTQNKPVLIFSMEMSSEQLATRILSSIGRVSQQRLRSGNLKDDDWPRLTSAVGMMSECKLFIDDTPAMSPIELRARARRLARQHGQLGLIVIDYLQLMQVPGFKENRTNEISEISRSLKILAKEADVPVIALSQLNRSLEQRQDKRPVMSDLRESGAIEQDADVIAFIYRDEVYNDNSPDKGTAEVIIGKQRNGPIGKVRLSFLGEFSRFENHCPEAALSL